MDLGLGEEQTQLYIYIGLSHHIHSGVNRGKVTIVVFFDLKSAYDTVDHINMLASKGIQ